MRRARGGSNNSDSDVDNPPLTQEQLEIVRAGVPNIRAVRRHMGMTQQQFAVFGPHFEPGKQSCETAVAMCAPHQPHQFSIGIDVELTFDEIEVDA